MLHSNRLTRLIARCNARRVAATQLTYYTNCTLCCFSHLLDTNIFLTGRKITLPLKSCVLSPRNRTINKSSFLLSDYRLSYSCGKKTFVQIVGPSVRYCQCGSFSIKISIVFFTEIRETSNLIQNS